MSEPLIQPGDLVLTDTSEIAYASAWIRAYCGWHIFPSQQDTITIDTFGGQLLLLPTLYMTALGEVVLTADASTVDSTTLSWSQSGALAYRPTLVENAFGVTASIPQPCWPIGLRTIQVTFTHGYDEVPDAIKAVAVGVAKRLATGFTNVTSEQAGLVLRSYGGPNFTPAEQAALNRYRIWP